VSHRPSFLPWPSFEDTKAQKQERRKSLFQAFLGAICAHGVLFVCVPYWMQREASMLQPKPSLSLEIQHFMEPNPQAPVNEPDTAQAIAYKSQQAAQERMSQSPLGDLPSIEGEIADSQSIVEASLSSSLLFSVEWLASESQSTRKAVLPENLDRASTLQVSGDDLPLQALADSTLGEGVKVERLKPEALERSPEDPIILNLSLDESLEALPVAEATPVEAPAPVQRPAPQPRPRLSAKALQAPILKSQTRVASLGVLAIDAKWSLFGAYQQQVLEAISRQWHLLASHLKSVERDKKSEVVIEFYLNPDGRVEGLRVLKTNASMSATLVCQDAIRSREPFGIWPEEMVKLFGKEKRVCIHFFYR
jgi:hypothetical protein